MLGYWGYNWGRVGEFFGQFTPLGATIHIVIFAVMSVNEIPVIEAIRREFTILTLACIASLLNVHALRSSEFEHISSALA
jgi:hypothetical protein